MESSPLFYIPIPGDDKAAGGPYDLKQMARLLRTQIINKETMICREGDSVWKPFGEDAQYTVAEAMPIEVAATPADSPDEEAQAPASIIPLPSSAVMLQVARAAALILVGAALWLAGRWPLWLTP